MQSRLLTSILVVVGTTPSGWPFLALCRSTERHPSSPDLLKWFQFVATHTHAHLQKLSQLKLLMECWLNKFMMEYGRWVGLGYKS